MNEQNISYYDNLTPWGRYGENFFIRGFALRESMSPTVVHHGENADYPWPWLLLFFEDSAFWNPGLPSEIHCEQSLILCPPGTSHRYGNPSRPWTHSWMIVDEPEMASLLNVYPIPTGTLFRIDAGGIFEKYLPLFHSELTRPVSDPHAQSALLQLFLYELHRQSKSGAEPISPRVREMERYLARNLAGEVSVESAASHFALSGAHFSALFREYYHTSPMNYLNTLRMNRAAQLLRLYQYSCKEAAEETGFRDPLYFSRRFREFWGSSPSEYRKKNL